MIISSLENSKVKDIVKLQSKKYRDLTNTFVVETEHLVEEAEKVGIVKELYLVEDEFVDRDDTYFVTKEVMKKMSSMESPSNVLAVCEKSNSNEIIGDKILLLDGIQDPGNLGTIIRSAVAFGIDNIITSEDTVDYLNSKVLRASEGMVFHINIVEKDLFEELPKLKDKYKIYTTNVVNGSDVSKINVDKPYAIIMGNEGNGVKSKIAEYASDAIYIPMNEACESLNVAIATSIILYEFSKK